MTRNLKQIDHSLGTRVAETYTARGFDVIVEPKKDELPFDLGDYRPDLIASKKPNEGYIIEVKDSVSRTPIERYSEVAKLVSQHEGWRFLLVTADDVTNAEAEPRDKMLLTWEQMLARRDRAEQQLKLGADEGAFLNLWGVLEAALRRRAEEIKLPAERLPTASLLNHLYSQGELSIEQFDDLRALQVIRNRFVHGYQTLEIQPLVERLQLLVDGLLDSWSVS